MELILFRKFLRSQVLPIAIAIVLVLFAPAVTGFFFADDWFHLGVSQITSIGKLANFFSFEMTPQYAGSYRPLSTQVFFWLGQIFFGINPLPYHLLAMGFFVADLVLVYILVRELSANRKAGLIALMLYGVSATNFTRLYFISSVQEVLMVFFVLVAIVCYLRPKTRVVWGIASFSLALLSKETAIVLPFMLLLIDWYRKNVDLRRFVPFVVVAGIYAMLRFGRLGGITGESYVWDFTLRKTANSLFWYGVWTLGVPEFVVDYVGSGLRILPRFFSNFGGWAYVMIFWATALLGSFCALVCRDVKARWRTLALGGAIFVGSLAPVIFLPLHKFTLELGLPLVGFSLLVGVMSMRKDMFVYLFVIVFIAGNVCTNLLLQRYHYSVNQAKLSEKIFEYFKRNYPKPPSGKYFEFVNDTADFGPEWGSSRQIAQATSESNMFAVLYHDPSYKVYFADFSGPRPRDKNEIAISTKMFTGQ